MHMFMAPYGKPEKILHGITHNDDHLYWFSCV